MTEPRSLMHRLLDYIGEQAKDIDPRGFRLSAAKGFLRRPAEIAGLPGVETDLKVAGDHVWMRVPRLVASKPRAVSENFKALIRVSEDEVVTAGAQAEIIEEYPEDKYSPSALILGFTSAGRALHI